MHVLCACRCVHTLVTAEWCMHIMSMLTTEHAHMVSHKMNLRAYTHMLCHIATTLTIFY